MNPRRVVVGPDVRIRAVPGVPIATPGDDVAALCLGAIDRAVEGRAVEGRAGEGRATRDHADLALAHGDVLVVASKLVSRAEGRFVDVSTVTPSGRARDLAARVGADPRLVELVLSESTHVSRAAPGALIVRSRLGHVLANAGIDASNAAPPDAPADSGPWVLLLPQDPDRTARSLCEAAARRGARIGAVISDSLGRPFRLGTVGAAIGVAGLPALLDRRGDRDLHGRALEHTEVALADQLAAAADMVAGQADEARALIHIRGVTFAGADDPPDADDAYAAVSAGELVRPVKGDLYL